MKIPADAKLVFKGEIFDVYQWEQKMYDGSFATFEMLKRPNTILVIPTIQENIVISHQEQPSKPPFDSLLGGRGEEGEEPLTTAKRELLEESGLSSTEWELFKVYEPFSKMDWQIYIYIARNCTKVAEQKLDVGEKIQLEEVSFNHFMQTVTSEIFWGGEFSLDMMRLKQNPEKLEEFREKLFQ